MSEPITITATVAAWLPAYHKPHELLAAVRAGQYTSAINKMGFYGEPGQGSFGDWVRVGEADITVRLIPENEQVALAVKQLQAELEKTRTAWLERQRQILEQIQNLQAITFDAEVSA
jgi:hypothetical protein